MQLHKKSPERGFANQALELSQRARARALLDSLDDRQTTTDNSREDSATDRNYQNLKQSLSAKAMKRAELLRAGSMAGVKDIRCRNKPTSDAYERAASVIRTRRAKSADRPAPQVLSATEIQQQSDGQTVLVGICSCDSRSYYVAVISDSD